jgi:hypothetical protein
MGKRVLDVGGKGERKTWGGLKRGNGMRLEKKLFGKIFFGKFEVSFVSRKGGAVEG